MSGSPMIAAHALVREFDGVRAVDGVDLTVTTGEIHAIVGLNGAGKTTLMRLLLGMLRPEAGEALVLGSAATSAPPEVWRLVGHLIETPFAYPELTVRENLEVAAMLHDVPRRTIRAAVTREIDRFELGAWRDRRARVLSLGNRQRLGLASALVHDPTVLILDEPANSLDPAGVVFVRGLLRDLAAGGASILLSSHHLDQLARVAHRVTVLHRGRTVGSIDPDGTDLEQRFFDIVYAADVEAGAAP
jgi:ABC-2 type transport system ATP-binding protein